MLVICVTLIILTFFAFEMEFIYTFLIYLLKVKHVYGHTGTVLASDKLGDK